jgi:predicted nucleic acid-binding protein
VAVIVSDTSTWVDYLNGQPNALLGEAVDNGTVVLPPLVVAEMVSGALTMEQRNAVGEIVQFAPIHDTPLAHWIDVGLLRQQLRRKGITVTLPDAHVAQCALELDATLLSRDDIFPLIAHHTSLRVTSAAT